MSDSDLSEMGCSDGRGSRCSWVVAKTGADDVAASRSIITRSAIRASSGRYSLTYRSFKSQSYTVICSLYRELSWRCGEKTLRTYAMTTMQYDGM
uniref:Uncharacterized protein n=1 Tax=Trichuris muris TaxID=70415 RepID=A0A5S6QXC9_TRIMR